MPCARSLSYAIHREIFEAATSCIAEEVPPHKVNCADVDPASYEDICSDEMEFHSTVDTNTYVETEVCNLRVATAGGTCADYCATQGRVCRHAQDNTGDTCVLDAAHDRQTTEQNGCLQGWGDQVCGCGSLMRSGDGRPVQEIRECEGDSVTITCADQPGTAIDVYDASYGRIHGPVVCQHDLTSDQECHADNSVDIGAPQTGGGQGCF